MAAPQRRFGIPKIRGLPRPKTVDQFQDKYLQSKTYLYGIKSVRLEWSKKGDGHTSTRHFHYYEVPPLKFWNPDIHFKEVKRFAEPNPSLTVEMNDGSTRAIRITKEMTQEDIKQELLKLSKPNPFGPTPSYTTTTPPSAATSTAFAAATKATQATSTPPLAQRVSNQASQPPRQSPSTTSTTTNATKGQSRTTPPPPRNKSNQNQETTPKRTSKEAK